MMQVPTYQVFPATFKVHLTFCMLNYMLFTRVFFLTKTRILMTLFVTLILYIASTSSRSLHEVLCLCGFDSRYKGVNSADKCHFYHTLSKGNQCVDYMTKLGASSNIKFLLHSSPPNDLMHLLKTDAAETLFSRE